MFGSFGCSFVSSFRHGFVRPTLSPVLPHGRTDGTTMRSSVRRSSPPITETLPPPLHHALSRAPRARTPPVPHPTRLPAPQPTARHQTIHADAGPNHIMKLLSAIARWKRPPDCGISMTDMTAPPPADSPKIVTRSGLPLNAAALSRTHSIAPPYPTNRSSQTRHGPTRPTEPDGPGSRTCRDRS